MLTNECWLGYHGQCSAWETCDCMCHDIWDWDDAFSDGPTVERIAQETYEALKKDGWIKEENWEEYM